MTNCCKIIATYFGNRHRSPKNGSDVLKLMKFTVQKEVEIDPGVDLDTIIINNKSGYGPGEEYLNSIDGMKTNRGKIKVLHRENVGISYGAYNFAFKKFRDKYKYWFFLEDDNVAVEDGYYYNCLKLLNSDKGIAFVGVMGLSKGKQKIHANGGYGLSSDKYLGEVFDMFGKLPYYDGKLNLKNWSNSIYPHTIFGEIEFTNIFVQNGYKIVDLVFGEKVKGRNLSGPIIREGKLNRLIGL